MINFIVQTNLLKQEDLEILKTALRENSSTWYPVKVVPFMYEYVEGEPYSGFFKTIPTFVLGSITLMKIAAHNRWKPGVITNKNFKYDKYIEHYGQEMLNFDAQYYRFKDVPHFEGYKFIRPVNDNKAFAGQIIPGDEFSAWQDRTLELEVDTFPETMVLIAEPTNIFAEYRFFVVGGKVITGSMYHYKNRLMIRPLEYEYNLDMQAMAYAQDRVNQWSPAEHFVIDIAVTDETEKTYKIMEVNGINAAGPYKSDVSALISAIQEYYR